MSVVLPQSLLKQLERVIAAQSHLAVGRVEDSASKERVLRNFQWVKQLAEVHYQSRITRATELASKPVAVAQDLARRYIGAGNHDFFATCVDGRNMPTVMFSKPPHVGGVLRSPAGILSGFMAGSSRNSVFIDDSTFVVKQISKLLQEKAGDTIFYGLDSHLACAARGQIHATEGGRQEDAGLRSDILSKIMMARGILHLRQELLSKGKEVAEVIPTFFSFDPHSGGVWFGLETQVQESDVAANGFTDEKLTALVEQEKVISSMALLREEVVVHALNQAIEAESADFRHDYAASLQRNWQAITDLYADGQSQLFAVLLQKMTTVYQKAGWLIGESDHFDQHCISHRALKQKTKFLLKNLVTRYSIAGTSSKWPFDHHQEEMVVITDGGYAPFPATDAFAVFSRDLNGLLPNTKLTIDLIRSSRREQKLQNPFPEIAFSQADFVAAPVLISNKAIVKGLSDEEWEALVAIGLSELFAQLNWDDMNMLEWRKSDVATRILTHVNEKDIALEIAGTLRLIDGIYELFDRMRLLMKDKYFRQMMFTGNVLVLNTLVNENRYPKLILNVVV